MASQRTPKKPEDDAASGGPVIAAVGAVTLGPGETVLLIRRGRGALRGAWSLPGGHIEPGERAEDAVVREVFEETAMRVRVVRRLETFDLAWGASTYRIEEFLCAPLDPTQPPAAGDDASDARWVPRGELAALGVSKDVIRIVAGSGPGPRT